MVKTQVPSKHLIGIVESQIGIEQELFFKFIHSPFAHLKGVSVGHPLTEGHTVFFERQLPSGHNFLPSPQTGFSGQSPSFSTQLPSLHLIGK